MCSRVGWSILDSVPFGSVSRLPTLVAPERTSACASASASTSNHCELEQRRMMVLYSQQQYRRMCAAIHL